MQERKSVIVFPTTKLQSPIRKQQTSQLKSPIKRQSMTLLTQSSPKKKLSVTNIIPLKKAASKFYEIKQRSELINISVEFLQAIQKQKLREYTDLNLIAKTISKNYLYKQIVAQYGIQTLRLLSTFLEFQQIQQNKQFQYKNINQNKKFFLILEGKIKDNSGNIYNKGEGFGYNFIHQLSSFTSFQQQSETLELLVLDFMDYKTVTYQKNTEDIKLHSEFFQNLPLFKCVLNNVAQDLYKCSYLQTCEKDQVIFQQGNPTENIYIIKSGQFELTQKVNHTDQNNIDDSINSGLKNSNFVSHREKPHKIIRIGLLEQNQIFGETDMLNYENSFRQFTATCQSKGQVYVLQKQLFFHKIMDQDHNTCNLSDRFMKHIEQINKYHKEKISHQIQTQFENRFLLTQTQFDRSARPHPKNRKVTKKRALKDIIMQNNQDINNSNNNSLDNSFSILDRSKELINSNSHLIASSRTNRTSQPIQLREKKQSTHDTNKNNNYNININQNNPAMNQSQQDYYMSASFNGNRYFSKNNKKVSNFFQEKRQFQYVNNNMMSSSEYLMQSEQSLLNQGKQQDKQVHKQDIRKFPSLHNNNNQIDNVSSPNKEKRASLYYNNSSNNIVIQQQQQQSHGKLQSAPFYNLNSNQKQSHGSLTERAEQYSVKRNMFSPSKSKSKNNNLEQQFSYINFNTVQQEFQLQEDMRPKYLSQSVKKLSYIPLDQLQDKYDKEEILSQKIGGLSKDMKIFQNEKFWDFYDKVKSNQESEKQQNNQNSKKWKENQRKFINSDKTYIMEKFFQSMKHAQKEKYYKKPLTKFNNYESVQDTINVIINKQRQTNKTYSFDKAKVDLINYMHRQK